MCIHAISAETINAKQQLRPNYLSHQQLLQVNKALESVHSQVAAALQQSFEDLTGKLEGSKTAFWNDIQRIHSVQKPIAIVIACISQGPLSYELLALV